ncbi:hypothetical protein L207DRAFT_578472 [Hyaloscypha variabilis F]|uniref:Heterokaryon incompatibility domain-containing protein n=1 Tax=Hyaloscypha variabilis (strain UAMH 11265 / GT02V1 / F) TaxID=1149755 RepID=A0A2J6S468_HYAVF|nr:hypothetical protein L207DRAFT_578472 [Hyaloscypha variabilis F]
MDEESQSLPLYEYSPLEHHETVRALVLSPATQFDEPLRVEIVHVDSRQIWKDSTGDMAFDAVSYAWGREPKFICPLLCQGGTSCFLVTPNVDSLLRHIRHPTKHRRLWIDSICLNQVDDEEKTSQVARMADIYRQARKIRIWLGDAKGEAVPAIWSFLRTIGGWSSRDFDPSKIEQLLYDFAGKDAPGHLLKFLEREWFTRRWILQEVASGRGRTVQCGPHKMPWDCMVVALEAILKLGSLSPRFGQSQIVDGIQNLVSIGNQTPGLLSQLWDFHTAKCSDNRDRIFALLSMTKDFTEHGPYQISRGRPVCGFKISISVSYVKRWHEIYEDLCKASLRSYFGYEIFVHLLYFGSLWDSDEKFPSWIPDWRRPRFSTRDYILRHESVDTASQIKGLPRIDINDRDEISIGHEIYGDGSVTHTFNLDELARGSDAKEAFEDFVRAREISDESSYFYHPFKIESYLPTEDDSKPWTGGWLKEPQKTALSFDDIKHLGSMVPSLLATLQLLAKAEQERILPCTDQSNKEGTFTCTSSKTRQFGSYEEFASMLDDPSRHGCEDLHLFLLDNKSIGISRNRLRCNDKVFPVKNPRFQTIVGWGRPETLIDGYALRPVTKLGLTKYQFLGACYLQNVKERYSGIKSTSSFTFPLYDKDESTLATLLSHGRSKLEKWAHGGEGKRGQD